MLSFVNISIMQDICLIYANITVISTICKYSSQCFTIVFNFMHYMYDLELSKYIVIFS